MESLKTDQTFPKRLKINQATDFKRVFQQGKKYAQRCFAVITYPNSENYSRLGMVVGKKAVRKAHERNQIKRVIREVFRFNRQQVPGLDIVVVAYHGIDTLSKHELRECLDSQWAKLTSSTKG